jgi:hypothetical protein
VLTEPAARGAKGLARTNRFSYADADVKGRDCNVVAKTAASA